MDEEKQTHTVVKLGKGKAQLIGSYCRVTKNTKITVKFNYGQISTICNTCNVSSHS